MCDLFITIKKNLTQWVEARAHVGKKISIISSVDEDEYLWTGWGKKKEEMRALEIYIRESGNNIRKRDSSPSCASGEMRNFQWVTR